MPGELGAGTINRAVNFLDDEEAALDGFAKRHGVTFADLTRKALRVYVALAGDKKTAVQLARIRRARTKPLTVKQRRTRAILCAAAFFPMVLSLDFSAVRPVRSARRQETAEFFCQVNSGFC